MNFAIIGAGIGGLTTALALEKNNIPHQVYERAPQLNEIGAGIWLAPNALQVFDYLGILNEVKAKGNSINRITLGKADLSPLSDNYQDRLSESVDYSTVAIHRAQLQRLLINQLPEHKINLGKGLNSFERIGDEKIKLVFEDNSIAETDFLIGADGINSKVRKQLFPESTIRYTGQTCWRGVADVSIEKDFENRGIELWGDQIRFGLSKIAPDKVYWFAVALKEANGKDSGNIQDKLLKMYDEFHPLVKKLIAATPTDTILRNDINDLKPLKTWYKNNVGLIGDAGHATTPNMGQGGAQAIEDAYYLCHMICKYPKEEFFARFQQIRNKKVNAIVKQSRQTGSMAHWKYGRGIRNFFLKNVPTKFVTKKMLEMYHIEKFS